MEKVKAHESYKHICYQNCTRIGCFELVISTGRFLLNICFSINIQSDANSHSGNLLYYTIPKSFGCILQKGSKEQTVEMNDDTTQG